MLRRHLNSDFVGGAYVFPGGKVDEADRTAGAEEACVGRTDAVASDMLGTPSRGAGLLGGGAPGVLRGGRRPPGLPRGGRPRAAPSSTCTIPPPAAGWPPGGWS